MSDQAYHLWTDQQKQGPSPIEITIVAPEEDESSGEAAAIKGTAAEPNTSNEPLLEPKLAESESPSLPRVRLSSQSYRDAVGGRPSIAEKHRYSLYTL